MTPLDFELMFANGISATIDFNGPHPQVAPRTTPPNATRNFQCLDVFLDGETVPNDFLDDFQCNATDAQWFHFTADRQLLTVADTCVTASGAFSSANIGVQDCNGSAAQQWFLAGGGLLASNLGATLVAPWCADVQAQSAKPGTPIVLGTCAYGNPPPAETFVPNLIWPTLSIPQPPDSNSPSASILASIDPTVHPGPEFPVSSAGGWIDDSQQLAGDFDGDGFSDVAYVFKSDGVTGSQNPGRIDIDVYLHSDGYVSPHRWSTELGGWIDGMIFLAGDFDGDGLDDIAATFTDFPAVPAFVPQPQISIDVHRSMGSAARGGFAGPERWGNLQGNQIDGATWLAGDFDGDGKADLAYVFPFNGINIDVHKSRGSLGAGGFVLQRWATTQGGWIDLTVSDPANGLAPGGHDPYDGMCKHCSRQGQWVAGDFNGDQKMDLGLAYQQDGHINLDAHLSTGSAFVLQNGAVAQGGWVSESWWVAEDMDDDGRADMVDVFASENIDVHASTISGLAIPGAQGFVLRRYDSILANRFWHQPDPNSPVGGRTQGSVVAGNFVHGKFSGFGDLVFVQPFYQADHQQSCLCDGFGCSFPSQCNFPTNVDLTFIF